MTALMAIAKGLIVAHFREPFTSQHIDRRKIIARKQATWDHKILETNDKINPAIGPEHTKTFHRSIRLARYSFALPVSFIGMEEFDAVSIFCHARVRKNMLFAVAIKRFAEFLRTDRMGASPASLLFHLNAESRFRHSSFSISITNMFVTSLQTVMLALPTLPASSSCSRPAACNAMQ
jgi:hypothetical protein